MSTSVIHIKTYDELRLFARNFSSSKHNLLILTGDPGLGKTQTFDAALGNRRHLRIDGHTSPMGLYRQLYYHRDEPVIIDDLDGIHANREIVRLLKALCNTDPVKTLRWTTSHPDIGDGDGQSPEEFQTSAKVCLLANDWHSINANVKAIEDRALRLQFAPPANEVHVQAREWFEDVEVYHFVEKHLHLIRRPSFRIYTKGQELRKAMPEQWRSYLLAEMGIDDGLRAAAKIVHDPSFRTEKDREEAFRKCGLGDRATYYRRKKQLKRGAN